MFVSRGGSDSAPIDIGDSIANSLMLDSASSQYLSRTFGTPTSRRIFTISWWMKRGTLGGSEAVLGNAGTREVVGYFGNTSGVGDSLHFRDTSGGAYEVTSTAVFRDPSAHSHCVVAFDTTQATASNRVKMYVNGVQITTFNVASYPAQNTDLNLNSAVVHAIGRRGDVATYYLDGYLSRICFVDGQALTPSSFGRTSADTGQWVNKTYAGTYGNNGFKLDFANSADLGNDVSGNNNDWTTNGGISSANQYTDTPTNNYAVLSPIDGTARGTITIGNTKTTVSTTGDVSRGTMYPVTGKWYAEFLMTKPSSAGQINVGVVGAKQAQSNPSSLASIPAGMWVYRDDGYYANNGSSAGPLTTVATGDRIRIAFDADAGKLWWAINGVWMNSGDPAAGTNALYTNLSVATWGGFTFMVNHCSSTYPGVAIINSGAQAFRGEYSSGTASSSGYTGTGLPPTGFKALCTANLPTPTILKPSLHFNADAYIGNGSSIIVRDNQQTAAIPSPDIAYSLMLDSGASQYLSRTFGTPTDNTIWTFSFWWKRGKLAFRSAFLSDSAWTHGAYIGSADQLSIGGSATLNSTKTLTSTASFDHIVFTNNGTTSNIYVNNVLWVTGTTTITLMNSAGVKYLFGQTSVGGYGEGYFANTIYVDGQALTPSSFGQWDPVTSRWVPKTYNPTGVALTDYGNNGFNLDFAEAGATAGSNAGLGKDISGRGNYWTTVGGIGAASQVTDTPTNNFVTVSQTDKYSTVVVSKGNLALNCASGNRVALTGFGLTSGKWYFEGKFTGTMTGGVMGIARANVDKTQYVGFDANGWSVLLGYTCNKLTANVAAGAGSSYIGTSALTGEVVCCALDMDNGKVWWRLKNGAWGGSAGGDPVAGTGEAFGGITGPVFPAADGDSRGEFLWNFGATAFAYSAPAGFNKITSQSLPKVQDFAPDLIWLKSRTAATDNVIVDSVRGWDKKLITNTTAAEVTDVNVVTQTLDGGYVLGNTAAVNTLAATYVGWSWKGGGAAVTNNVGTIASQVSANTTAGISIVTYTGATGNQTVGHGVQVGGVATAPKMIIVKGRNTTTPYGWFVYHASTASPSTTRLEMQSTAAAVSGTPNPWASTAPSTTVFSLYAGATYPEVNENGKNYLALCFAEVEGFSKIGSYTGNAAADGTFVYCGFKPRWIIIKSSTAATDWYLIDTARDMNNECVAEVNANNAVAEQIGTYFKADMVANGFKLRIAGGETNAAQTYIFYAIAEAPMKFSTAR